MQLPVLYRLSLRPVLDVNKAILRLCAFSGCRSVAQRKFPSLIAKIRTDLYESAAFSGYPDLSVREASKEAVQGPARAGDSGKF